MIARSALRFAVAAVAALACLVSTGAHAQAYPSRSVRMVVPFAPGGATDIIARTVAQKLADRLGQSVVVENKPGAGTTIGNAEVAKAKPDGYTLLFAPTPFVISQVVYPTLPYDPQKDFAPVSLLATSPFILVVNAAFPAKSTAELVALAKAKPGTIDVRLGGQRHRPALVGRTLQAPRRHRHRARAVQGRRPGDRRPRRRDRCTMMFATPIEVNAARAGGQAARARRRRRCKRLAAMPDVPTLAESGYPDFEVLSFFGVLAPAGTPPEIVNSARVGARGGHGAARRARAVRRSRAPGRACSAPRQFAAFLARERDKWADIVKRSGAKVD